MRHPLLKVILVVTAIVVYSHLFWLQKLGINLLLFSTLLMGLGILFNPEALKSRKVWATVLGTLLSGVLVVLHNSGISKFMHIASFIVTVGFIHERGLRSVIGSVTAMVANLAMVPVSAYRSLATYAKGHRYLSVVWRFSKIIVVPTCVFLVFYWLYRGGNPVFDQMAGAFSDKLVSLVGSLFGDLSFARIAYLFLGIFIIGAVVLNANIGRLLSKNTSGKDALQRKRGYTLVDLGFAPKKSLNPMRLGLKKENLCGVILIAMVNLLLLLVNFIDIQTLWFGFEVPEVFSLKEFVYRGTALLILSILLTIAILLYFFRGNQNFYSKSKPLKYLAYFWIFQNLILGYSVFLRNYYYIDYHGMAYLRIGVVTFLTLVLVGLVTMAFKISRVKSFFYLFRVNTWATYTVLMLLCTVNWDVFIVEYNVAHRNPSEIDIDNYLRLSYKAYPVIYANLDKIARQMEEHRKNEQIWVDELDIEAFKHKLDEQLEESLVDHVQYGWQSWNLPDHRTNAYFMKAKTAKSKYAVMAEL